MEVAAHAPQQTKATTAQRVNYIDWLRVLAVLLLIPFHTARIFDIWEANYVKNSDLSRVLTFGVVGFLNQWHMPLLFLLAGAATWFALGFRNRGQYTSERFKRLLIPFVFGILVIVPPQAYLARFQDPQYSGSYLQFLSDYVLVRGDLSGYTGLFTPGHLWFILFLFCFSLLALPLFTHLKTERGQRRIASFAAFCAKPGGLFLLVIPLLVAGALPDIGGKNPFLYITIFIYGFLLMSDESFQTIIDHNKAGALLAAAVLTACVLGLYAGNFRPARYSMADILFFIVRVACTWSWLIAILGYGRQYLNYSDNLLRYASEAAYPFYILHQTVIIVIGYYVVRWNMAAGLKFLVIACASLAATLLIYELVVRRFDPVRFLFGMKPLKRVAATPKPAMARPV